MISDELIKNFFEEQFEDISPFFLYKDHQLLKENKFREFIERQLIKSRKRFIFGIVSAIAGSLFWFSKQYFIISSSMSLFQKMLTKQNTKSV